MTALRSHDWAGSLYKGLSLVTAGLNLPVIAFTVIVLGAVLLFSMGDGMSLLDVWPGLLLFCLVVFGWLAWCRLTVAFWLHGSPGLRAVSRAWWWLLQLTILWSLCFFFPWMLDLWEGAKTDSLFYALLTAQLSSLYLLYLRYRTR